MFANLKLYAIAFALLAIGFLVWREHVAVQKAKALAVQNAQLTATISAERENTKRAYEAEQAVVAKLADLDRRARDEPLPRLRCRAASVPQASGTAIPGEAAQADDAGENATDFDPSPELDHFATDSESNLIQCKAAIEFLQSLE